MPTNVEPKARFQFIPLEGSNRPKRSYSYYVTGRGPFPFDMLRYDCAWPAGSEDALLLFSEHDRERKSVNLRSYSEPTVGRWASFGWSVGITKLY